MTGIPPRVSANAQHAGCRRRRARRGREEDTVGLLDDLLGGVLGGAPGLPNGGALPPQRQASAGGGMGGVMMALLPVVLSMLASRGGGGRQGGGGLGDILGQVLGGSGGQPGAGSSGGLGGLIEQMQRAGYGDQARSWVGTGQNMPISPDDLGQVFGPGGIEEIARRAGVTPQEASEGLSELLPEVVDHVTPGGEAPDLDQLTRSVDEMRRRLGA